MNDVNEDYAWFLLAEYIIYYYAYYLNRVREI